MKEELQKIVGILCDEVVGVSTISGLGEYKYANTRNEHGVSLRTSIFRHQLRYTYK